MYHMQLANVCKFNILSEGPSSGISRESLILSKGLSSKCRFLVYCLGSAACVFHYLHWLWFELKQTIPCHIQMVYFSEISGFKEICFGVNINKLQTIASVGSG